MRLRSIGRVWRGGLSVAVSAAVLVVAMPPASAQDEGRLDQDDVQRMQEMSPDERREFLEQRRRSRLESRIRRQLEAQGLEGEELERELERRIDERLQRLLGDVLPDEDENAEDEIEGEQGEAAVEDLGEVIVGEDETIELRFAEPVSLARLVEFVGQVLEVNIFSDPNLENERVAISAPVEIERDRLLGLLSTLLEDSGFTLTQAGEEFYRVTRDPRVELEGGDLATTRIIATPNLRPSALQSIIQTTFGGGQQQAGGPLRISPLDELGVLIVTGGSSTLSRVQSLVERLAEEGERQALHLLPVDNVAAGFARQRMIELHGRIAGANQGVGQARQQTNVQRVATGAGGGLSNLDDRLYVHSGNTLLFRGTTSELPEVAELLAVVDKLSPLRPVRYQPGGVTAEVVQAAEALGLGTAETVSIPEQGVGGRFGQRGIRQPQQVTGGGDATVGDSRFLVDEENGTFVYFGTETQHEVVAEIVERFRKDMIDNGTQIRVYRLVYAQAAPLRGGGGGGTGALTTGTGGGGGGGAQLTGAPGDEGVAELLRQLIEDPEARQEGRFLPGGRGVGRGGGISEAEDALIAERQEALAETIEDALGGTRLVATSENTVIVADQARNQVLIKAPALAHRQFERIIEELDKRQKQVSLNIQIVTLSTDDAFNWDTAVDLDFGDVSLSSLFGAGAPTADAAGIQEAIAVNSISPGFTAAVIDNDEVPFAINTLATVTDSISISRPQLFVMDNQTATLDSADEVPFAETTVNASTTTTGQGGVAEAGTLVQITPRISDAGEITLALQVELSSFTGPASDGLQPPALRNQFVTQVTLPNNSTIIVGGFESTSDSETEEGIPLLKDIPLLGNLFKTVSITRSRTAVFVFITPTILDDPNDLGLRLLTEGPLKEAGLNDGMPTYQAVVIPVAGDVEEPGPERVPERGDWYDEWAEDRPEDGI